MGDERTLRIFTAAFETETNTFSPLPTGLESFERNGLQRGRFGPVTPALHTAAMIAWRALAERDGSAVVESIAASAEPAGRVLQSVYERLRDELLADLRTAMPIDVVLLYLHGAMVAENQDDCEGDILASVRRIVGPDVVVGTELDLHCHLTEAMVAHATAIVTFKEYPHDDIVAEAEALYRLCRSAALGRTRPVMSLYDCRMIGAAWPTTREPVRSFVAKMRALECEDVLSASLGHGYPWGDVADVGAKVLVIADGDRERARYHAADLARAFWEMREAARYPALSIDSGLDAALDEPLGPIVLADGADNAGGGAPSDSTFVLRRIIERGIRNVASAAYFDPMSVAICFEAGARQHDRSTRRRETRHSLGGAARSARDRSRSSRRTRTGFARRRDVARTVGVGARERCGSRAGLRQNTDVCPKCLYGAWNHPCGQKTHRR